MNFCPDKNSKISLQQQLKQALYDFVQQQQPGSKLPSENEIAMRFGISRTTVSLVYRQLADEGVVYQIRGSGSFAAARQDDIFFILPCEEALRCTNRIPLSLLYRKAQHYGNEMRLNLDNVIFSSSNSPYDIDISNIKKLPDGGKVIVYGYWFKSIFPYLQKKRCQVALIDCDNGKAMHFKEYIDQWIRIRFSHENALQEAMTILKRNGRRKIAFLHWFWQYYDDRMVEFRKAMQKSGLKIHPELMICVRNNFLHDILEHMLFLHEYYAFDAILFDESDIAKEALNFFTAKKIRVPKDIELISFCNNPDLKNETPQINFLLFSELDAVKSGMQLLSKSNFCPMTVSINSTFHPTICK